MALLDRLLRPISRSIAKELLNEMERIYFPNAEHVLEPAGDTGKVLYYIHSHAGTTIEEMKQDLGIGERTLRGILKTLIELNIVECRTTVKGRKVYYINDKYANRIRFKPSLLEKRVREE
ncbi:MAG: hypothetical protein GXO42_03185 [bacterium]|nr:hypothetical protein [bacterium]